MSYPVSKSTEENTSDGMGKGGHLLLSSGGTTGATFTRAVSVIDVKSGVVVVDSAVQIAKRKDPENASDYPDWASVTLEKGVHLVDFSNCVLSGATGLTQVNYGI
jgi:hypothetical protein